jgi:hypothetical protein
MLKRYDGVNILKWNVEDEPFVVLCVQKEGDVLVLRVVKDHMLI